jgi:hypothetical protein
MYRPTVTKLVRKTPFTTLRAAFSEVIPDQVFDLNMDTNLKTRAMRAPDCGLGDEFHKALASGIRGEWVAPLFWPFVFVILAWMESEGVINKRSEWEFRQSKQLKARCDVLTKGGLNETGILEFKLTGKIPDAEALPEAHLAELSLYAYASAETDKAVDPCKRWGAVVYVCPSARSLRVFQFTTMTHCCAAAETILKAA